MTTYTPGCLIAASVLSQPDQGTSVPEDNRGLEVRLALVHTLSLLRRAWPLTKTTVMPNSNSIFAEHSNYVRHRNEAAIVCKEGHPEVHFVFPRVLLCHDKPVSLWLSSAGQGGFGLKEYVIKGTWTPT